LTPVTVSTSVIGGFVLFVTLLRALINKGELRYHKRLNPTIMNTVVSVVGSMLLYGIGPAIAPLTVFRVHHNLGPTIYGFVWTVSFGVSVGVVFFLVKNVAFLAFFGALCFLYILTIVLVLVMCRKNTWKTFFFSTRNWKDALRGELWGEWKYGSSYWGNDLLLGDEDAHYAGMVAFLISSDLPWDKLKVWLMSKKSDFMVDPPLWLTEHWLTLLPTTIRDEIWTVDEMLELKESIRQVKINLKHVVTRAKNSSAHLLLHQNDKGTEDVALPSNLSPNAALSISATQGDMDHVSTMGKRISEKIEYSDHTSSNVHSSVLSGVVGVVTQITERQRPPQGNDPSQLEGGAEDDEKKRIRQQIAITARRRSSIMESIRNFVPRPMLKPDALLADLATPIFLNNLLDGAATMSIEEVNEVIALAVNEDFAVKLIEGMADDNNDNFPALLIGALIKYLRKEDKRNNETSGLARTVISAFFEVGDEVSDFVLAILFLVDSGDLKWAATLMFVFMGLNRFMGALLAYTCKEPFLRCIEALIGIRSITDTFRILTQGSEMMSGTVSLIQVRASTLIVGLTFESLPQMVLQLSIVLAEMKSGTLDQGILAAQIVSVLASCLSIGLSFASLSIDGCKAKKIYHPSMSTWLPSNDGFRETILFICLVAWSFLHVLLVACGFSALFAFADYVVSLPIVLGHFFLFNTMRYAVNDVGWRGLSMYKMQNTSTALITLPLIMTLAFIGGQTVPAMQLRAQCISGPSVFTYGISSSILIAMVSLFVYIPDTSMKLLFIVLSIMYFLVVIVFLVTMDENIFTFLFSTTNWKETLRDELWDIPSHGSRMFGIPELVGDHDANHAAHIDSYTSCYLPWEKITTWLRSKKAAFLESPPLWMTPGWFDKLTPEVKCNVWTEPGELEELLTKVKEVCAKAKQQ